MEKQDLRPLNPMEQAFTISNARLPLCVVCVLHLSEVPEELEWEEVLQKLQTRHALLRCGIEKSGGHWYFRALQPLRPIAFEQIQRLEADQWKRVAEAALNTIFETDGPLMKCWLLREENYTEGELIICFHHAIIDGSAARQVLHEILAIAGGVDLADPVAASTRHRLPGSFRGSNFIRKMSGFMFRQLQSESQYARKGLKNTIPPHSENAVISLRLTPDVSRRLAVKAGRAGLGLNSILLAAILQATVRHRYPKRDKEMARVLSFVDLRPALEPPVAPEELGCFISMLRLEVGLTPELSSWQLAREIHSALFKAGRRGEVFAMYKMSKHLVKMALNLKIMRLGVSAISFIGRLDLNAQYGPIRLNEVRAFITNNQYGPELSAFGKILFGSIGLDFTYLTAETSREQAAHMIGEIQQTLEKMAE